MHPNAKDAIRRHAVGFLKNVTVLGRSVGNENFAMHFASVAKEILKHKHDWVTTQDIYSIFFNCIANAIAAMPHDGVGEVRQLSAVIGDDGLAKLADELVAFIDSFPRTYTAKIPIPELPDLGDSIYISEAIAISRYQSDVALRGGGLLALVPENHGASNYALELKVRGFAGYGGQSSAARQALSGYKLILQQALACGLVAPKMGIITLAMMLRTSRVSHPKPSIEFIEDTSGPIAPFSVELSPELSSLLSSYSFRFKSAEVAGKVSEIRAALRDAAWLYAAEDDGVGRLRTACEWHLDGLTSLSPTMALVQTSIGFEALFGEDDENSSLTRMLADRCAYLVATNLKARKQIRDTFVRFYQARSKIVHGNTIFLSEADDELLFWGRRMLQLAISKEMTHVKPSNVE